MKRIFWRLIFNPAIVPESDIKPGGILVMDSGELIFIRIGVANQYTAVVINFRQINRFFDFRNSAMYGVRNRTNQMFHLSKIRQHAFGNQIVQIIFDVLSFSGGWNEYRFFAP